MRRRIAGWVKTGFSRGAPIMILWIIAVTCLALDLAAARNAGVVWTTIPLFAVAVLGSLRLRVPSPSAHHANSSR